MKLKTIDKFFIFCLIYMVIFMFGMFFLTEARAQDDPPLGAATLSWTGPVQNTDGSPLTDLAGYRIYYGNQPGRYPNMVIIDNPAVTSYVVESLVPRTWFFVSTSVNEAGVESVFSNEAQKTIEGVVGPDPLPPANLVVADNTVYTVVKQENVFVLLPIGTIDPGVPCDPTQSVNGRYVVPRDQVEWSGDIRPLVVVADCS